jgi:hypothetical protein
MQGLTVSRPTDLIIIEDFTLGTLDFVKECLDLYILQPTCSNKIIGTDDVIYNLFESQGVVSYLLVVDKAMVL